MESAGEIPVDSVHANPYIGAAKIRNFQVLRIC
jgi:hypothetical protein